MTPETEEQFGHSWWKITPFYYTSMFGYRCFRLCKTKRGLYKFRLQKKYDVLKWIVQKIIYSRKCKSCKHPLYTHVSYDKFPDREGVCIDYDCMQDVKPCEAYL